jgi:hypothetical protein
LWSYITCFNFPYVYIATTYSVYVHMFSICHIDDACLCTYRVHDNVQIVRAVCHVYVLHMFC